MTSRRQFLERSLLGFGSAFLLPSLLQSCLQDHVIPDPTKPPINPPLFETSIDWNDDAKTMVTSAIEMIPEVGDLLGGLVDIFWPSSKQDVWGDIKAQMEALVDQKIADAVYQDVTNDLTGLNYAMNLFMNELKNGSAETKLIQWISTRTTFVNALPHFQSKGYELPLLGLFAQFVNLYLTLLRDGIVFGLSWGMPYTDRQQLIEDLKAAIPNFSGYVTALHEQHQEYLQGTKPDNALCEPFRTKNIYNRQITLTVLDFRDLWPYFDPIEYPQGTTALLTREIFTDPLGTCDNSGNIVIATPPPTQRPTNLTVWGYDRIDAVQLTYPSGSGPGGVTTTPRMGDQPDGHGFGGSTQQPYGGSFNLTAENPIIAVRVITALFQNNSGVFGPLVAQLQFLYGDRTSTYLMGGTAGSIDGTSDTGWIGYTNEFVSSIHINGVNKVMGTADSIVIGYQYAVQAAAQLNAIRTLYITSPKERTAADFAKEFPMLAIPASLITDELQAARKAHWEALEARVKGPK